MKKKILVRIPLQGEEMIFGIGVDTVEIERIKKAISRHGEKFLKRVFTMREIAWCNRRSDPAPCLAGRFAAKEAVLKSLGTGLAGCRWTDVEVLSGEGGAPEVQLHGGAAATAGSRQASRVLVSISHDSGRAVAFAMALKGGGNNAGCYGP